MSKLTPLDEISCISPHSTGLTKKEDDTFGMMTGEFSGKFRSRLISLRKI